MVAMPRAGDAALAELTEGAHLAVAMQDVQAPRARLIKAVEQQLLQREAGGAQCRRKHGGTVAL
eukprot:5074846-Prymnesium_polylepis.1